MAQQINNDSKVIRSADSSYELPKQEIVCSFIVGSYIFCRNLEENFNVESKTIQQKIIEQQPVSPTPTPVPPTATQPPPSPTPSPTPTLQPAWIQRGSDINAESVGDLFGETVSLNQDGTVLAIGAPNSDENTTGSGQVKIYEWDGSQWIQRGTDILGVPGYNKTGESISLNAAGNVIVIGSPLETESFEILYAGAVRVYEWNGSSWTQRGATFRGNQQDGLYGESVSLNANGDVVAIGTQWKNANGIEKSGSVEIYMWNESEWIQLGSSIDGTSIDDWSGKSVSLNAEGNIVAIGAPKSYLNTGNIGYIRVYVWDGSSWTQRGTDINAEELDDDTGVSVDLNDAGDILAIGAPANDGNGIDSGTVKVYAWNDTEWVQLGNNINGEAADDASGGRLSLNSTGDIIAIGAPNNRVFGNAVGHVRVYAWNGSSWIQKGIDINGSSSESFSGSGTGVSLNGTGEILAVGAPMHGVGGKVKVYYWRS